MFYVPSKQSVSLWVRVKLDEFDGDERAENWPFRKLVGSLMRLSISTRPDISNAMQAVARYCTAPRALSTGRQPLPWHIGVHYEK